MGLAIYLSYALQFYVPIELTRCLLKEQLQTHRAVAITEFSYRTLLVLAICECTTDCDLTDGDLTDDGVRNVSNPGFFVAVLLAENVPDLGLFISLLGALTSTTLSFVFPPLFSALVNWSLGYGRYNWLLWKDVLIVVFGLTTCLAGTYVRMRINVFT